MPNQPHLFLVDGSAYIFRAYHRLPPLTNKHGEPVGAVYGYTTMLWRLVDDLNAADGPTHMAVIFDYSSKTFRNDLYAEYKAHRPEPPEDLKPQFPMIRDATRAFSLPCIEEEGVEADDIIATYSKLALDAGFKVTIVSSDKDLMQLIEPGLDLYDTMNDRRLGADYVQEKFGVQPDKLGDILALMGDSVDNVPGVPGIGPKTAAKLLGEHSDLEAVLAAAPDMKKSKMKENLIEHSENARLSRVLVTLKDDCAIPEPLEDFALKGIPEAPLREFLEHHGFGSLLKRLGQVTGSHGPKPMLGESADTPAAPQAAATLPEMPKIDTSGYACITEIDALDHWIVRAREEGVLAFDTETDSLEAVTAQLVGISLAVAPNEACYIPIAHGGGDMFGERPVQCAMDAVFAKLKPLLEDDSVLKIGQNLKYDMSVLAQHGITLAPFDDTMVMSFCLDAGQEVGGGHGMDALAKTHLDHDPISYKSLTGTGKKAIGFHEVALKDATCYAAEDADVTLRLWKHLKLRMAPEGAAQVYERVDRPLIPVVARMECRGIKVDREALSRLSAEFAKQMEALVATIHELAGEPFAIGSPKQLGDILFDKMGLKGGKRGKSGQYSTDQSVLEKLDAQGVEMASKVLEWRQLSKLKSTYTDALQAQINPKTGRVHTSYSLVGAQTGRLSSTDPNLQNIPIRTAIGRQIREAFVADPGNVLLAADYSQIELRLAAHIADVPELREAFEAGEDIHNRTAQELFGTVDRDTRGRAKTINFAILYGISRWGLARRLEVEPDEAQAMIDTYFQRFPGIAQYMARTLESVRSKGFSETLFGRKTHFPRIGSKNQAERQGSERAAINAPIQGTSADIIKRAMARMEPALKDADLPHVKMLLQVHDELVFELPEENVAAARPVIERVMAEAAAPAVQLSVPLGVEIGIGKSWDAAH